MILWDAEFTTTELFQFLEPLTVPTPTHLEEILVDLGALSTATWYKRTALEATNNTQPPLLA
jgi:hypothetical protein